MKNIFKLCLLTIILISYQTGYSKNKGLSNCVNSCFFNASLQALSHLDKFNSQLEEKLYDPNDLIPRFYINLMNKIKGNGKIECSDKILDNWTEQNFYDLVGITFFFRGDDEVVSTQPSHIDNKFIKKKITEKEVTKKIKGKTTKTKTKITTFTINGNHFLEEFNIDKHTFVNKYLIQKEDKGEFAKIFLRNQEDADEFVTLMINKLIYPEDKATTKEIEDKTETLQNLFNLKEISELNKACGHKSVRNESILKLSVPVINQKKAIPLLNCLNTWASKEQLNEVRCDNCRKNDRATKQSTIGILPNYFMIQLKRFGFDLKTLKSTKFLTPIQLPQPLKIDKNSNYVNAELREILEPFVISYNLLAFIIHNGKTANSGHYWTYGKDKANKWWRYNDSTVTNGSVQRKIGKSKINDSVSDILKTGLDSGATPYILFYELDDASRKKLEELGLLEPLPESAKPATEEHKDPLQQNLDQLKTSLQELKIKLQTLQEKLGALKEKLG